MGFSLAHDFNETAAMDLNQFRKVYIMHMADHATRHSAMTIIIESKMRFLLIRFLNTG